MNTIQDFDFDTWFDFFLVACKRLEYTGAVDKYTLEWNWEDGETPEYAAEQFVKEMRE